MSSFVMCVWGRVEGPKFAEKWLKEQNGVNLQKYAGYIPHPQHDLCPCLNLLANVTFYSKYMCCFDKLKFPPKS